MTTSSRSQRGTTGRSGGLATSAPGIIGSMHVIRFFELGSAGDVDLAGVCRLINRAQRVIQAEVGDPVESIGEPDIEMRGYSKRRLFGLFPQRAGPESLVGISRAPIEGNLFSMTQLPGSIVLSLHETEDILDRANRSAEQDVAQSGLSEFLQIRYMLTPASPSWRAGITSAAILAPSRSREPQTSGLCRSLADS